MTSYCSALYLALILPLSAFVYGIVSKKARPYILIAADYLVFWSISGKLAIWLFISTMCIHHAGLWLADIQSSRDERLKAPGDMSKKEIRNLFMKKQRGVVTIAVLFNVGLLAFFKYSGFFFGNINTLLEMLKLNISLDIPSYTAPIGISFYTLQAVAYIYDVYREKIPADKNFGRLCLFMSFFPQIMEGPICRYSDTAEKLWQSDNIHYRSFLFGIERIAFGVMKKVVIADRLNIFIQNVYGKHSVYDGGVIALAAIAYTIQLYMEFSGTMDVILGSGEIFGITLPENFARPFFSKTITEFWKRWHITLGTWFKDYIFYPLSMSKPLKKLTMNARKKLGKHYGPLCSGTIALFCVWLGNGIWHGAGWQFIFFGMYHFVLILIGSLLEPPIIFVTDKLRINRESGVYKVFQIIKTAVLVCIGEMFFRAEGLRAGLSMFKSLVCDFTFKSFFNNEILKLGMDEKDFLIVGIALIIVAFVSVLNEKKISVREKIASFRLPVRVIIYYAFLLFIIIFGAYGVGYVPIDPIYADF